MISATKMIGGVIAAICAFALTINAPDAPGEILMPLGSLPKVTIYVTMPPVATTDWQQNVTADMAPCDQYAYMAVSLGWPSAEISTLKKVMHRESRCIANAHNQADTVGQSYGLTQVNTFWCEPSTYWPQGWLQTKGIITTCEDLLHPRANLAAAYAIFQNSGWAPWSTSK